VFASVFMVFSFECLGSLGFAAPINEMRPPLALPRISGQIN
jgi:hypothetical protein